MKARLLLLLFSLFSLYSFKPLNKETLNILKADQLIFDSFYQRLRGLSCKLIAYSKIKTLYDSEEIDKYLNQTRYKRTFLNSLNDHLLELCLEKSTDDKMVFNTTLYEKYDDNPSGNAVLQGYNITHVLHTVNELKEHPSKKKEDL